MNKATFSLENFIFSKVELNFPSDLTDELNLKFTPIGEYNEAEGQFSLTFIFEASFKSETAMDPIVTVQCDSTFIFVDKPIFEELPPYFYRNSIAILFPYVRAFVTTVTTQANIRPIILPTMNLSSLEVPLKQATTVIR